MGTTMNDDNNGGRSNRPGAMAMVRTPRAFWRVAKVMAAGVLAAPVALLVVPWQQNVPGAGRVVAHAPLERQQMVEAPIEGRIVRWWVAEGSAVREGDPLVEVSDIDPGLVERLTEERAALAGKLENYAAKARSYEQQVANLEKTRDLSVSAAEFQVEAGRQKVASAKAGRDAAMATLRAAEVQFKRKVELLKEEVVTQRDFDLAERDVEVARTGYRSADAAVTAAEAELRAMEAGLSRTRADAESRVDSAKALWSEARAEGEDARASLAKVDVSLSRQQSRVIRAPREGTVLRLVANQGGEIVKAGDPLVVLVPAAVDRVVELWVSGNDAPLIREGSPVRVQFEGWPAVQFAGWPSVAVGTFGGQVTLVDQADDGNGRFRVLVRPESGGEAWPDGRYLRQGTRAKAWVLLDRVALGYEFWRQLNGFPPVIGDGEGGEGLARKRLK